MVGREMVLAAASALSASAFLIPAGVTPTTNDFAVSFEDPKNHVVRLPCPGCVFTNGVGGEDDSKIESSDDTVWIQGGANDILLNLAVTDDQRLELNGATIFPMKDIAGASRPVRVVQIPAHASQEEYEEGFVRSSKLDVTESGMLVASKDDFESGDSLTTLRYSIMELESNRMALDDVIIDILTTADDELLIVDTRLLPNMFADMPPFLEDGAAPIPDFHTSPMPADVIEDLRKSVMPHHDHHPKPKCGIFPSTVCRLATAIESKVSDIKSYFSGEESGCGGRGPVIGHVPGHIKPPFLRGSDRPADGSPPPPPPPPHHHHGAPPPPPPPHGPHGGPPPPPHGPHGGPPPPHGPHGGPPPPPHDGPHHGPHHRHHGHRHHHSFLRSMAHGFFAVIVPTLAGIMVGVSISVFGILVGRALSFFWINVVRGGRPGYASVALVEQPFDNADVEDKGEVLVDEADVEALPQYEDAPPYESEKTAKDDA